MPINKDQQGMYTMAEEFLGSISTYYTLLQFAIKSLFSLVITSFATRKNELFSKIKNRKKEISL